MRTSNPALSNDVFMQRWGGVDSADRMTVQGTVNKTGLLLLLATLTAMLTWNQFYASGGNPNAITGWMMLGGLGGFIVAMITVFKKEYSPMLAPAYALLKGFFLGGISSMFEARFPGIVVQSVMCTLGVTLALLFLYKSRMVTVSDKFRMGVIACTGGIAIVYIGSMILGFFGMNVGFIHSSGPMGILFSLFVVAVAALNLMLDFDFIETGERAGAPSYMEWYAAFGLMVTLVWLYVEILRLLSKLRDKR
jgi:uncharacterized YccA/Bax inhibitor family protein